MYLHKPRDDCEKCLKELAYQREYHRKRYQSDPAFREKQKAYARKASAKKDVNG